MADFTKNNAADIIANNPGVNMGTSGSLHEIDWGTEDLYWREQYVTRPYARADRDYQHFQHAYRYGAESRARHAGREWTDVEPELERGWDTYRGKSQTKWGEIKDAVRDAFHRGRR